ncbi:MAG: hypothetical protein ACRC56_04830 [Bosea sp. (in: a-proteobacteria)]
MLTIRSRLDQKWLTFSYNFGWSDYVDVLDGWIPRLSFAMPIVGYLILFNDSIAKHLTFTELTSGHSSLGLSGGDRLKFLYLGLVFLGLANIIYRWKRPYVIRRAQDLNSYVEMGLKNFTLNTFFELHVKIRNSGFDAYTPEGDYYTSDWDAFYGHATGDIAGERNSGADPKRAHWVEAKAKYEHILRSILKETFFREDTRTRRGWLTTCLAIAAIGYILLAVPSIDLFMRVMAAIFMPLS